MKLTQEVREQLVADIRRGIPQYRAAQRLGIFPDTVSKWKAKDPELKLAIDKALSEFGDEIDGGIYEIAQDRAHPDRFKALCRIKDTRFASESPRVKKLALELMDTYEHHLLSFVETLDREAQQRFEEAINGARSTALGGQVAPAQSGPTDRQNTPAH